MRFKDESELPQSESLPFIKLADRAEINGVFRGDPVDMVKHWDNGKSTICKGSKEACEACKRGVKKRFTFRINFITKEGDQVVAKVFESGRPTYDDLRELSKDWDLSSTYVKIKRNGTGTDTRYSIIPLQNGSLKPEQMKTIEAVKLNVLSPKGSAHPEESSDSNDEAPF